MGLNKGKLRRLLFPLRPEGSARKSNDERVPGAALQAIWDVVAMIPRGKVSTYGDVARAAGFPGRARHTGYALRMLPKDLQLPWHRVVGAGGRIVFPKASAHYREQGRRLRSEGVAVNNGRVPRSALMHAEP